MPPCTERHGWHCGRRRDDAAAMFPNPGMPEPQDVYCYAQTADRGHTV
jgi:hypothetical protein